MSMSISQSEFESFDKKKVNFCNYLQSTMSLSLPLSLSLYVFVYLHSLGVAHTLSDSNQCLNFAKK